jgi:hypothetical protein
LLIGCELCGDAVDARDREFLPVVEIRDLGLGGVRDEFGRGGAQHQEAGFEIAAGVGDFGIAAHA